ncbi:cysteine hydrolase family protein [Photobacterium leiognathi subsp. mandapamensis]
MSKKALLVLDVINELVHPEGSVGQDGFCEQAEKRHILRNIQKVVSHAREHAIPVYYVIVGFSEDYKEWSPNTKLFREVKSKKQVVLGSWETQVHETVAPREQELIITKHRINPFYNTSLNLLLKVAGIEELVLTGVSSEFVVLATVLSAHDRDMKVTVLEDCISSSDEYSHQCATHIMTKLAELSDSNQFVAIGQ